MKNPGFYLPRLVIALALALSAVGVSVTAALAAPPEKYQVTLNGGAEITNLCSFSIHLESIFTITFTNFFDKDGVLVRSYYHFVAQDTLSANGKSLAGIAYTYNSQWVFDHSGSLTHVYLEGIIEKVPLPDGGLFISAGWVDISADPFGFTLTPDRGNPGNIAGLCAALSA